MSTVISVSSLSKAYRLGTISSRTLREDLSRAWARLLRKPDPLSPLSPLPSSPRTASPRSEDRRSKIEDGFSRSPNSHLPASPEAPSPLSPLPSAPRSAAALFWALHDVSFEVKQGEVLGIIGANGAGKSTLLKILSRITAPTTGELRVKGRIASLLEIGTGFHPDLTGRENLFLNGAILGMSKAEIRSKFDEIVAFSEVEQFIDTPVKRYSSGMYVRLAFAVAAHLEPEILIIDEVLSVGDATFQRKCLGKMGEVARHGRTVLFVSHNMVAVQSLCGRALFLSHGGAQALGPVGEVVPLYLKRASTVSGRERVWPDLSSAPGNDLVRVAAIRVQPASASTDGLIAMETPVLVELDVQRLQPEKPVHCTFHLVNQQEVTVLTSSPGLYPAACGRYRSRCIIPGNLLNSGDYRLRFLVVEDASSVTFTDEAIASFSVEDLRKREIGWMGREPSAVQIPLAWRTEVLNGALQ